MNDFFSTKLKVGLSSTLRFLIRNSDRYRTGVRAAARRIGLEKALLTSTIARRILLTKDEPRYQGIYDTAAVTVNHTGSFELHLLFCERDLLRGIWALKSFYRYANLDPHLVIHNDGTLSPQSIQIIQAHFPGCTLKSGNIPDDVLDDYPLCRYYRKKHVLARKIIDVLLAARSDYVMVMDTDVLWFSESPQIRDCVQTSRPFFLPAIRDAYARNTRFLNEHCNLFPARHVNSGIIGFHPKEFLDLDFIENALDRMINIPQELVAESIGYPVPEPVKQGVYDPVESVSWWVMEQTLYALLYGRSTNVLQLNVQNPAAGKVHQYVNAAITGNTALQHFLLDSHWNAQFPVGVEYLLKEGFLRSTA